LTEELGPFDGPISRVKGNIRSRRLVVWISLTPHQLSRTRSHTVAHGRTRAQRVYYVNLNQEPTARNVSLR
jgi:hypothetical protein